MADDEELKESQQESEEKSSRLHTIERSQLRGAQATRNAKNKREGAKRNVKSSARSEQSVREQRTRRRRKSKKGKMLVLLMFIVVAAFFLLTTVFASAHIQIVLSSSELEVPINGVFSAIREPAQSKGISYRQFPPFKEVREEKITNVIGEPQNTRAEGTATLYNLNPSGQSLDLVPRTRLQTESGQIYFISGRQSIPGGKKTGDAFVPGKKEVKIEASGVGDEYNLPQPGVRLSIPGLAQRKEYADSYAITETKIVGGFSGEKLIPDEEEEKAVRERLRKELEVTLRDSLAQAVQNNSLAERVVFEEGVFIEFESLDNQQDDGAVVIREEGTLYAISFREIELATLLAEYAPSGLQTTAPARVDIESLSMSIEKGGEEGEFDIISSTEFSFKLSGSAKLFWDIDDVLFLSDIVGKKRTEVEQIIDNEYPQVKQISEIAIFPAWRTSFPENKKKIEVVKGY